MQRRGHDGVGTGAGGGFGEALGVALGAADAGSDALAAGVGGDGGAVDLAHLIERESVELAGVATGDDVIDARGGEAVHNAFEGGVVDGIVCERGDVNAGDAGESGADAGGHARSLRRMMASGRLVRPGWSLVPRPGPVMGAA